METESPGKDDVLEWSLHTSLPIDSEHVLSEITGPKPCQKSQGQRCKRLYLFRVSVEFYRPFFFFQNRKDTTFTVDHSCYFCTFILPYWRHTQGCKLMWSISKSGPKLCQIKDPTSTQSQCHCEKSFLLALSLFWSYPVQSLLLFIFHSTLFVAVRYAV